MLVDYFYIPTVVYVSHKILYKSLIDLVLKATYILASA